MRAEFNARGPRHDYTRANVTLLWRGRTLLGTVRRVYCDEWGTFYARVLHFDGSDWPTEPTLASVEILERS